MSLRPGAQSSGGCTNGAQERGRRGEPAQAPGGTGPQEELAPRGANGPRHRPRPAGAGSGISPPAAGLPKDRRRGGGRMGAGDGVPPRCLHELEQTGLLLQTARAARSGAEESPAAGGPGAGGRRGPRLKGLATCGFSSRHQARLLAGTGGKGRERAARPRPRWPISPSGSAPRAGAWSCFRRSPSAARSATSGSGWAS